MLIQILLGALVILVTIVIQVVLISTAIVQLTKYGGWLAKPPYFIKTVYSLFMVTIWLMCGVFLSASAWAVLFLVVGCFKTLEPALYFSIVTFSTLGYGDITLEPKWRLLASFAAVNGLFIFGLNTAFIAEFTQRLRNARNLD